MSLFTGMSPVEVAKIWRGLPPPNRPSELALKIYARHLDRVETQGIGSILVLGATPELRMLVLRRGFKVVFADHDSLMIQAMNLLMDYSGVDRAHETCFECEWLELPETPSGYEVVLGDGSLNFLTMEQMRTLLVKLRGLVNDSGSLCLNVITYPKSRGQPTVAQVFSKYRERVVEDRSRMFRVLEKRLLLAKGVYQKTTRTSSYRRLANELKKAYSSGEIAKEEFDAFAPVEKIEFTPTIPFRGEFAGLLSPEFRIECINALEYPEYVDFKRIYELKPR